MPTLKWIKERSHLYRYTLHLLRFQNNFQGEVHSETVLPLLADPRGCANRSQMLPFGAIRLNVDKVVDHHVYETSNVVPSAEPSTISF